VCSKSLCDYDSTLCAIAADGGFTKRSQFDINGADSDMTVVGNDSSPLVRRGETQRHATFANRSQPLNFLDR
jgi:hypothetical protein